jgi:hypothetical protein
VSGVDIQTLSEVVEVLAQDLGPGTAEHPLTWTNVAAGVSIAATNGPNRKRAGIRMPPRKNVGIIVSASPAAPVGAHGV